MNSAIKWPLMKNNISRKDLDLLINYLKIDDPKLTHGPKVREFEQKWSEWLGVKYSVMVNSGASANDLSMLAIRELYGTGEIIVPALTWVSDIASVLHAGHTPVFVDIDKKSLAMSADEILKSINKNTKAVFLTHVLGLNGLTDKLLDGLKRQKIPLIEDVCESHGAKHKNNKLGTYGFMSNFSFYYAHHLTTIEGGMISTNDSDLYELLRMMRSHGLVREVTLDSIKDKFSFNYPDLNPDFIFSVPSHNMRPNELNGILGISQLDSLDKNIALRKNNYEKFLQILDPEFFQTEFELEGNSNYAFTLILKAPNFDLRDKIEKNLKNVGIEFRRGLSGGGNQLRQPYLKRTNKYPNPVTLPNVEHVHNFGWYLGNYPELNNEFYSVLKSSLDLSVSSFLLN